MADNVLNPDTNLPKEVLEIVFSHLLERDVCAMAQVNSFFYAVAHDAVIWERLYKDLFEYELPFFFERDARRSYFVRMPPNIDENLFPGMQIEPNMPENPSSSSSTSPAPDNWQRFRSIWEESFQRLYRAVHVRGGYKGKRQIGRTVRYFDEIQDALDFFQDFEEGYIDENNVEAVVRDIVTTMVIKVDDEPMIFVHPGEYEKEWLEIEIPHIILGCGPGWNPAENVIIENPFHEPIVSFRGDSGSSYLGYVTLVNSFIYGGENAALGDELGRFSLVACCICVIDATPTIDHCILITATANAVYVWGTAHPTIRYCEMDNIPGIAIEIEYSARGIYERNRIVRCWSAFGLDRNRDKITLRENIIEDCDEIGL